METIEITPVIKKNELSSLDREVLNAPDTKIRFRFIELDVDSRKCTVHVQYLAKRKRKWTSFVVRGHITPYLRNWLSKPRPVVDERGNPTGEMLSNFQRYLDRLGKDVDTLLEGYVFECENHSPEYALNPFSLRMSEKYSSIMVELVNMPSKIPMVRKDPMNGGEYVKYFLYPVRRDNPNRILRLPANHYKRVIVR